MKKISLTVFVLVFSVAGQCQTHTGSQKDKPWTFAIGAGTASHELTYFDLYDYNDNAYFISLQRNIKSWVSLEARYVDLGETHGKFFQIPPDVIFLQPNKMKISAKGLALAPVFTIPVNEHLRIAGRVGLSNLSVEEFILGGTTDPFHNKERQTKVFSGIAVTYRLNPTFSVGGSWDLYRVDTSKGNLDINHYALNVKVHF